MEPPKPSKPKKPSVILNAEWFPDLAPGENPFDRLPKPKPATGAQRKNNQKTNTPFDFPYVPPNPMNVKGQKTASAQNMQSFFTPEMIAAMTRLFGM